ncbi:RING-H2 finger protein ATL72-like [Trifolium pratense]|uniref:RING-type E3 ubiquitin transferase n=1 Tax=Trifolium pratense TaxID=57577 RepID=A0A2K3LKB0_TRIPR|nr:RING-H2 finger protein ATL72-like [Trifolium pratense]
MSLRQGLHRLLLDTNSPSKTASGNMHKPMGNFYSTGVLVAVGSISTCFVGTDCPICLGEFMDGEKVRVLPNCNHGFHVECIDKWLLSHSSCPTCRQSLLEYPTSSEASSVAVTVAAAVGNTNQRL